jgi:hypothetical protein
VGRSIAARHGGDFSRGRRHGGDDEAEAALEISAGLRKLEVEAASCNYAKAVQGGGGRQGGWPS